MDTNKILSANLLDLVFDNRNKDYGAYELRTTYERRVKKALIITGTIALLGFSGTLLANKLKPSEPPKLVITGHVLTALPPDPEPLQPVQPKPRPAAEPVRTEQFTRIEIKDDKDVENTMASNEDLLRAQIGVVKIDVPNEGGPDMPKDPDDGKGLIEGPKTPETSTFIPIERYAEFKGDWKKFLEMTLRSDVPVNNGAAPGRYTVMLQFVVDAEGSVSDIKALTSIGYGMEEEAIRTLKKAKKWTPALQNGKNVPIYMKQAITFIVQDE